MSSVSPDPEIPILLPRPDRRGKRGFEAVVAARRSVREFRDEPLSQREISQLLWATQGMTDPEEGLRAAPSAGALYPLELHLGTARGLFRYEPRAHSLLPEAARDPRPGLCRAALRQLSIRQAPAVFVITAVQSRSSGKYGRDLGQRYVELEVGHAAQNLLLQAVALGLGGVPIGAFHESDVRRVLGLPKQEQPLYLVPVGRPV